MSSLATTARRPIKDESARPLSECRTDEALVDASILGDQRAFDDLVFRHRHIAVRVAAGIVGSNLAEDVVRDALLVAFRDLGSLRDRMKFSRWFLAITRWRALRVRRNERRRATGRVSFDENMLGILTRIATDPRQRDAGNFSLLEALGTIPAEYAEVIRYHFLHRLTHLQIAGFLDVPLSTVKWRCFRGKEILRCTFSSEPTCPPVCRRCCGRFAKPSGKAGVT